MLWYVFLFFFSNTVDLCLTAIPKILDYFRNFDFIGFNLLLQECQSSKITNLTFNRLTFDVTVLQEREMEGKRWGGREK